MIPKAICTRTGMASVSIAWVETGEFTSTQKTELADIAFQCPWSGGDAVFFARSLYALIDPDAGYDDELLCSVGGQHRVQPQQTEAVEAGFDLYPNPAGDYVVLRTFGLSAEAHVTAVITDVLGRNLLQTTLASNGDAILDITRVKPGVVFVMLFAEGQRIGVRKLVVKQ